MKIPITYTITPSILTLLSEIESLRLYAEKGEINKHISFTLRRNSLLNSSLYSARIEGNQLTELTVNEEDADNETREITNIMRALEYVDSSQILRIDHIFIKKIHAIVGTQLFPEKGRYRKEVSGIFNAAGTAVYMPPPPTQVLPLMDKLIEYINAKTDFPLIVAFMVHLQFEKIHPFLDGNGRVGRILILAILKLKNSYSPVPVVVEEYLDTHREEYYDVLLSGLQNTERYLLFMLSAYLEQMKNSIKKLEDLSNKSPVIQELTARQEEIFHIIREHRAVSLNFIARRFLKVQERTLRDDIAKLIQKNLVIKVGNTKGVEYRAAISATS